MSTDGAKLRTLVFVDASNLSATTQKFSIDFDYVKFREFLSKSSTLIEVVVYLGLPPKTDSFRQKLAGQENFASMLEFNGFFVVKKYGKPQGVGGKHYKSNVDVLMAMDATEWAMTIKPEAVILVTGDGDFAHLATKLRRMGIKVIAAAFDGVNLADDLKKAANQTLDLASFTGPVPHTDPHSQAMDEQADEELLIETSPQSKAPHPTAPAK